jgi:hypothetical protein
MTKITKIHIEDKIWDEEYSSIAQTKYIQDLMKKNKELEKLYLNKLSFRINMRLSKKQASKLIGCLLENKEFVIIENKY